MLYNIQRFNSQQASTKQGKILIMVFLDFERPIADLYEQREKMELLGKKQRTDVSDQLLLIDEKIASERARIYSNLSPWQRVQISRHPQRPYTLFYINEICDKFIELHGDRNMGDDKAIVGGWGQIDGESIMFIGHQKGSDTKMRQYRNFGMPNPEGYRKALRLMKMAEKFKKPVVTFIDTPGAYPGIEAEERGQAQAIAQNLMEMSQLNVPILCIIIGEGASGGAIGIGLGDRILMLENTWYSVISPESCSSILWRSWDFKETAAEQLRLTAEDMKGAGIVDYIVKEPDYGAHNNPSEMAKTLKMHIQSHLKQLKELDTNTLISKRIDKYAQIGEYTMVDE